MRLLLLFALGNTCLLAQQPSTAVAPRDLFYVKPAAADKAAATPHRLVLRYHLIKLMDKRRPVPVGPDEIFREGDFAAIEFAPNTSGYLYVAHIGSTGEFTLLLPASEKDLPEQPKTVQAFQNIRIPNQAWFQFDKNPGTERIFIIVAEQPEAARRVIGEIREGAAPEAKRIATAAPPAEAALVSTQPVLPGRNITIQKVATSEFEGEWPDSVYAINTVYRQDDPLIVEVRLQHK